MPTDTLRPYQSECIAAVSEQLRTHRSTIYVAPTGCGKSVIAAEIVRTFPGNVLVIAHRWELLDQLRKHVTRRSGELTDLEQAGNTSDGARVVVASIQTIQKRKRLERFSPGHFGLVFVDECHHAVSPGYRRVLDYFGSAKLVGCTATPDRLDRVGMHNAFESVAYTYDIASGIRDGWLSRIHAEHVSVKSVDLSCVGSSMGDLAADQLDAVMSSRESLYAIATASLARAGNRPTIVFATSVGNAKALCEVLNSESYRPGCAEYVYADTPHDIRSEIYRRHEAGEFQFLVNVGILTEGFDAPYVSCIVLGRPTKSRALATQMIGRGLRVVPGKDDCLVLDFVGNAGRHSLITPADVLGGKFPPEVVAKAKEKLAKDDSLDVLELLDNEERAEKERIKAEAKEKEEAERRFLAKTSANVRYETTTVDLFRHFNIDISSVVVEANSAVQPGQIDRLRKYGIPVTSDMTRAQAAALIKKEAGRRFYGHATYKQVTTLAKFGIDATGMRMKQAAAELDKLAQGGWRKAS